MTSNPACLRCETPLVEGASYCHACGVGVIAAATGEYATFDLERFFTYALDLLCIAGTDGYFKRVNPAFERVLGFTAEELLSKPFVEFTHPDDRFDTVAEVGKLSSGAATITFENRYRCKDGSYRDLQWTSYPEPGTGLLYAVARDVTEVKRRRDRVDQLTGLASQRAFDEELPKEWNRARRYRQPLALAVFDVDDLRGLNERHGYPAGDRLLAGIGAVFRSHARRAGDLAARVGGQEFGLIMQSGLDATHALALCETLRQAVAGGGGGGAPATTISGGLAVRVPGDGDTYHRLVAAAETALAEAKSQGRNRVVLAPGE